MDNESDVSGIHSEDHNYLKDPHEESPDDPSPPWDASGLGYEWIPEGKPQFGLVHPSRNPAVALQFGHLSRRLLLAHRWYSDESHKDDFNPFRPDQDFYESALRLRRACAHLAIDFDPDVRAELDTMLDSLHSRFRDVFNECNPRRKRASIRASILDVSCVEVWHDLCNLADRALSARSPLRGLYHLGAALADYQWKLLPLQPLTYRASRFDSWPDPGDIARSSRELPKIIVERVPVLDSLNQLASEWDQTDQAEYLRGFMERVRNYLGLNLSEDELFRCNWVLYSGYKSDLFFRLYWYLFKKVCLIDFETIIQSRDVLRGLLRWEPGDGLWVGEVRVRKVGSNATNLQLILGAFNEECWPDSIDNPISNRPEQGGKRTHDAVNELNKGLTKVRFRVSGGAERIHWDPANGDD
jgi:hypothetical protein